MKFKSPHKRTIEFPIDLTINDMIKVLSLLPQDALLDHNVSITLNHKEFIETEKIVINALAEVEKKNKTDLFMSELENL